MKFDIDLEEIESGDYGIRAATFAQKILKVRDTVVSIAFCIAVVIAAVLLLLLPSKMSLRCDIQAKRCETISVNRLHMKKTKFLINPYDVTDVTVVTQKREREEDGVATTIKSYDVCFVDKNGSQVPVFEGYSDPSLAERVANELKNKFKAGGDIIEINDR